MTTDVSPVASPVTMLSHRDQFIKAQAAQAHYLWVRASEVIWWEILELLVYYLTPNKCKKS